MATTALTPRIGDTARALYRSEQAVYCVDRIDPDNGLVEGRIIRCDGRTFCGFMMNLAAWSELTG